MSKRLIYIFLFAFIFRAIFAFLTWHGDVYNHMDWGRRFFEYGTAKFYAPETNVWSFLWPNQPPGSIYLFAGVYKLFEFLFSIFWWINIKVPLFPSGIITYFEGNLYPALLKLPGILADLGIAFLIYRVIKKEAKSDKLKEKLAITGVVFFLFNPVIWYNSSVWGQYDSVIFFLAFLGFYLIFAKRSVFATLAFSLSLYTKATLLLFVPIFIIVWLNSKFSLKKYLLSAIIPLLIIGILTLPFSQSEPFSWLYNLYKNKVFVEQRQVITSNAFNIWAGLTGIHQIPHDNLFGPLSFKIWGFIFFILSYLVPIYLVFKKRDFKTVIWVLAIVSISAFSLLTNMHERYLYSFFPLFIILVIFDKKLLWIYILISLVNLLNLYNFWWVPEIGFIKRFLSQEGGFYARILGYLSFLLYLVLYKYFLKTLVIFRKEV